MNIRLSEVSAISRRNNNNNNSRPSTSQAQRELSKYFSQSEVLKRVTTFIGWPDSAPKSIKAYQFATAGFEYTTFKDEVRCDFCKIELSDWSEGDIPMHKHREKNPNCQFVAAFNENLELDVVEDGEEEDPDEFYGEIDLTQTANLLKENRAQRRLRSQTDVSSMKAANEQLRGQLRCKNCNAESIQTLFLPCRHLVSCETCAEKVESCFYCSTRIMGTVRAYVI